MNAFNSMEEAAEHFIKIADWLEDVHAPLITALLFQAQALDNRFTANMASEHRMTYTVLMNARNGEVKEVIDEFDDFLSKL